MLSHIADTFQGDNGIASGVPEVFSSPGKACYTQGFMRRVVIEERASRWQ